MNQEITFEQKIEKLIELLANEDFNILPLITKENSTVESTYLEKNTDPNPS